MERMSWNVDVDGRAHSISLDWSYWGGYRGVRVDGSVVDESTVPMRGRSEQRFEIDGHHAAVRTRPTSRLSPYFAIELELDERIVPPEPGPRSRWQR